jgi:hypothetical protein
MNYLKLVFQILFMICCITKIFAEENEEIEENDEIGNFFNFILKRTKLFFYLIEKSTNSPNTFHLVKKFMNLDLNKDNELTFSEIKLAFKDGIEDLKV